MRTQDNMAFLRSRNGGMTLIELMVALGIGSFLMIGALTVFMQSRTTFRVNESIARLQENARYVFDVMEPDIRMAHYWGLRTRAFVIDGRADDVAPLATAVAGDCGVNWAIDLDQAVESSNNAYSFTCGAFGTEVATADTLVVRRANPDIATLPLDATRIYIQSSRSNNSALFTAAAVPGAFSAATSETHALIVNGYYVSQNSTLDLGGVVVPSLRRKSLIAGPAIPHDEALPGVEDMQLHFGVDTDPVDGADRGVVDRYVNPDDAIFDPLDAAFNDDAEILTVRIWLRLRADRSETGLPADNGFTYADQVVGAFNDGFRRIVVSRTIYLRNARPAS